RACAPPRRASSVPGALARAGGAAAPPPQATRAGRPRRVVAFGAPRTRPRPRDEIRSTCHAAAATVAAHADAREPARTRGSSLKEEDQASPATPSTAGAGAAPLHTGRP
ncbi:Protein of unknown function, partial [Gryllus bimaculatus]